MFIFGPLTAFNLMEPIHFNLQEPHTELLFAHNENTILLYWKEWDRHSSLLKTKDA